jgi:hypothetical protein
MEGTVKIKDFMDHLKANNLVIVSKSDFVAVSEEDLQLKRSMLMKQKSISIREIVDAKLLPLRSKEGVRQWIKSNIIRPEEVLISSNGQIKILTVAIKRLGYV